MKFFLTAAALLLPVTASALECGKVDVDTYCYILQRKEPVTIVDGHVLNYVNLRDARCPTDTICVWEGFVRASFELTAGEGKVQTFELLLDPRFKDTNYYVDETTGLTVILDAVEAHARGPIPEGRDLLKVTVGYHLR